MRLWQARWHECLCPILKADWPPNRSRSAEAVAGAATGSEAGGADGAAAAAAVAAAPARAGATGAAGAAAGAAGAAASAAFPRADASSAAAGVAAWWTPRSKCHETVTTPKEWERGEKGSRKDGCVTRQKKSFVRVDKKWPRRKWQTQVEETSLVGKDKEAAGCFLFFLDWAWNRVSRKYSPPAKRSATDQ